MIKYPYIEVTFIIAEIKPILYSCGMLKVGSKLDLLNNSSF